MNKTYWLGQVVRRSIHNKIIETLLQNCCFGSNIAKKFALSSESQMNEK